MNYSDEQIKKALQQFIDDPDTARKFADAMRKGLEVDAMENEPQPFNDYENDKALEEINEELEELMELQGFTHWQTGGGCTAWGKYIFGGNDNESPYVMVTVTDDATAYFYDLAEAHQEKAICVYFYNTGGDANSGGEYYSWNEFKENFKGGF
jgi:hypothetical protein